MKQNEELKLAFIKMRDALTMIIDAMENNKTTTEPKNDDTVSRFWAALKEKNFDAAKQLYQRFAALKLTEKQIVLKNKMKKALIDRYEQEQRKNEIFF